MLDRKGDANLLRTFCVHAWFIEGTGGVVVVVKEELALVLVGGDV